MEFPTMAEKAIAEWRALTKTIPFQTIAVARGAFKDGQEWIFEDESIARWSGRGLSYKIEAGLP